MLKRYFSIGINSATNKRREKAIWQRRFWEHLIRDEDDLHRCLDYIHYTPVKHGYVEKPYDWENSTFGQHAKRGLYNINWGAHDEADVIKNQLLNE